MSVSKDKQLKQLEDELYEKSLVIFEKYEKDGLIFHNPKELLDLQKEYRDKAQQILNS